MTNLVSVKTLDVLLVEDDPGDALITREAFERSQIPNLLHVVDDGEKALNFLRRVSEYQEAPRPSLILLDINLPRLSGLEVLTELKSDRDLLTIPVVVLTTSGAQEDILRSYQLHASAYVTKPTGFDLFIDAIRKAGNYYYPDGSAGNLRTQAAEVEEAPVGNSHPHRAEGQAAGHPVDHQRCPFPSR